jgi:3-methyladenine DNA glycosylase AlkD/uncharacterized protein YdhG (YjbR/CyaY superfamily)
MAKAAAVDAYLSSVPRDKRAALEKLRAQIKAAAPGAEEVISYALPAFRLNGKVIAGFGASASHCTFYPFSGSVVAAHADDLEGFELSKGAVKFDASKPIPARLVKKLVQARIAEAEAGAKPAAKKAAKRAGGSAPDLKSVIADLKRNGSPQFRIDMVRRYGIVTSDETFGTPMAKIKAIAKPIGKNHALARELWDTEIYDARILASMVGDPNELSAAEMDRWCKAFDNWGVCDTLCFNLFDRSPHAWVKIDAWAKRKPEFEKRAAFALLATMALHKRGTEADFLKRLPLIEAASSDERNFVKKGVNWSLRAMKRGGPKVRAAAITLARKLAESEDKTQRWVGKDALRDLLK